MFFMIDTVDIASYADDSTPWIVKKKKQCDLETKLQQESVKVFKWFHENSLKVKDKYHFQFF